MTKNNDEASAITPEAIETALQFLASENGRKLLEARRGWSETRENLRTMVQQMRTIVRNETDDLSHVYNLVGEFVVRFSQLELWIRMAFGQQAEVNSETSLVIASQLDFRSLVAVTSDLYRREFDNKPVWKQIKRIFDRCNEVNDARLRIVHGSWILTSSGDFSSLHLSRQQRKWQPHFGSIEEIRAEISKLQDVEADFLSLMAGDYDPDPMDGE